MKRILKMLEEREVYRETALHKQVPITRNDKHITMMFDKLPKENLDKILEVTIADSRHFQSWLTELKSKSLFKFEPYIHYAGDGVPILVLTNDKCVRFTPAGFTVYNDLDCKITCKTPSFNFKTILEICLKDIKLLELSIYMGLVSVCDYIPEFRKLCEKCPEVIDSFIRYTNVYFNITKEIFFTSYDRIVNSLKRVDDIEIIDKARCSIIAINDNLREDIYGVIHKVHCDVPVIELCVNGLPEFYTIDTAVLGLDLRLEFVLLPLLKHLCGFYIHQGKTYCSLHLYPIESDFNFLP